MDRISDEAMSMAKHAVNSFVAHQSKSTTQDTQYDGTTVLLDVRGDGTTIWSIYAIDTVVVYFGEKLHMLFSYIDIEIR